VQAKIVVLGENSAGALQKPTSPVAEEFAMLDVLRRRLVADSRSNADGNCF